MIHERDRQTDRQTDRQCKPSGVREMTAGLGVCVTAVSDWCASKRLQLNTKKTEVMWFRDEPPQTLVG